jgi:hypothetical protein
VRNGEIRYVIIGRGKKRPRRMFTAADVEEFIQRQTRRDVPLPARVNYRSTRQDQSALSFTEGRAARLLAKKQR